MQHRSCSNALHIYHNTKRNDSVKQWLTISCYHEMRYHFRPFRNSGILWIVRLNLRKAINVQPSFDRLTFKWERTATAIELLQSPCDLCLYQFESWARNAKSAVLMLVRLLHTARSATLLYVTTAIIWVSIIASRMRQGCHVVKKTWIRQASNIYSFCYSKTSHAVYTRPKACMADCKPRLC